MLGTVCQSDAPWKKKRCSTPMLKPIFKSMLISMSSFAFPGGWSNHLRTLVSHVYVDRKEMMEDGV